MLALLALVLVLVLVLVLRFCLGRSEALLQKTLGFAMESGAAGACCTCAGGTFS